MSIHDRDYILRMIRQMVELLGRAVGRERPPPDEARRAIDDTAQSIFGPLYRTLRDVDAQTAASLVSDPEKRWALAALFVEEAKLDEAGGEARRAQRRLRTAAELLLDLAASSQALSDHGLETLRAVAPRIEAARLSAERRATLDRLLPERAS
jgi:hypothetical protein